MSITASRGLAKELEDGRLEVTIIVHRPSAAEFLANVPPDGWMQITSAPKPETQGVKPASTDAYRAPQPDGFNDTAAVTVGMSRHPYFQAFVKEMWSVQDCGAPSGNDQRDAYEWVIRNSRTPDGTYTDPQELEKLHVQFCKWCEAKGYKLNG